MISDRRQRNIIHFPKGTVMQLYQNEFSIIKYFNYDDTSKTKDVRKYQNINAILESLRFKNYLESQMRERASA